MKMVQVALEGEVVRELLSLLLIARLVVPTFSSVVVGGVSSNWLKGLIVHWAKLSYSGNLHLRRLQPLLFRLLLLDPQTVSL